MAQVDASGQKVVTAILEDGRRFEGDILIGADGIWSKVGFTSEQDCTISTRSSGKHGQCYNPEPSLYATAWCYN